MIVENICCQGSVLGYEFYFRSKVLVLDCLICYDYCTPISYKNNIGIH
jgi:hypothetical protein